MFNLKTHQVWTMRDVQWMNCNTVILEHHQKSWEATQGNYLYNDDYDALHERSTSDDKLATQDVSDDDNNDDDADGNDDGNDNEMESVEMTESNRVHARVLCEMHRLSGRFNPIANKVIDRAEAEAEETSNDSEDATHQSRREVANTMIESLPSQFVFYATAGVIDTNLDFNNAYKQIPIELTTFCEAYDHPDPEQ